MEAGIGSSRRPCFIEEDDGLTSLSDMEAGFSGNCQIRQRPPNQAMYSTRPLYYARRTSSSLKTVSCLVPSSNSPRSTRFYDAKSEDHHHQPHFLESCFGCKKQIGENRDIFMYRGDTPFCSEECRQDQIEIDEAKERNQNLASSMEAVRKKERKKSSSSSPTKPQNYPSRAGTVAAA